MTMHNLIIGVQNPMHDHVLDHLWVCSTHIMYDHLFKDMEVLSFFFNV